MTDTLIADTRIAIVSITRHGIALAGKIAHALPGARLFAPDKFAELAEAAAPGRATVYAGRTAEQIPALITGFDGIVAVVSLGAMVRLLAPHLGDKTHDPGVIVLDEGGRFVIPMLSGHLGGANALAARVADAIGAQPVLTTASDARQSLAVDLLGRELGWHFEASKAAVVAASAAVVNDEPVALVQEAGSTDWWRNHANGRSNAVPANIEILTDLAAVDPQRHRGVLWITHRPLSALPAALQSAIADRLVVYRPQEDAR